MISQSASQGAVPFHVDFDTRTISRSAQSGTKRRRTSLRSCTLGKPSLAKSICGPFDHVHSRTKHKSVCAIQLPHTSHLSHHILKQKLTCPSDSKTKCGRKSHRKCKSLGDRQNRCTG